MTQVSIYDTLRGKIHLGDSDIDKVYAYISSHPDKDLIDELRSTDRASERFDQIKNQLPIFTPHGKFCCGQKSDSKLVQASGLMYIDLDGPSAALEILQLKQREDCVMAFKSVSGRGFGVLINTNISELDMKLFRAYQRAFMDSLGIDYDNNALGLSRGCILTSDENVYYNPEAIKLDLTTLDVKKSKEIKKVSLSPFNKGGGISTVNDTFFKIRTQTVLDSSVYDGADYVVFEDGLPFVRAHLYGIKDGNRNIMMRRMVAGLIYNNPDVPKPILLNYVSAINNGYVRRVCTPLTDKEVYNIVNWVYDHHERGELDYQPTKAKKVWFSEGCTLTPKEKQSVARKEIGRIQSSKTQQKIYDAIEELQGCGKITAKSVSEKVGISLVTVKRYWPEFKDYVKELNGKNIG